MSSVSARIEAFAAWSAAPSSVRVWRTEAPKRSASPKSTTRVRACASLPVFYEAWPWTRGASWCLWKKERFDSFLTFDHARRVLWSSWMRALDGVGVEHGGRGVINLDDINAHGAAKRSLTRVLDRLDNLSADDSGASMSALALDLATTIGHAASVRSLGAGARVVSGHVAAITQLEVEAERRRIELDIGRAHLLGDIRVL